MSTDHSRKESTAINALSLEQRSGGDGHASPTISPPYRLSFSERYALYLEDDTSSSGTTSIWDLIVDKFADERVCMFLLHPSPKSLLRSEYLRLNTWCGEFRRMSAQLPLTPLKVSIWVYPAIPDNYPQALPRILKITREPLDESKTKLASLNGEFLDLT
ncbi:hypothetical protein ANO11243_091310 [Dothideomycetidae sp. 11243]|nr:hypothetical protein ANO11243_091310 [fungal sp. No.11243]